MITFSSVPELSGRSEGFMKIMLNSSPPNPIYYEEIIDYFDLNPPLAREATPVQAEEASEFTILPNSMIQSEFSD